MSGNAGLGFIDGSAGPTASDTTYIDETTPCDGDGWVTSIIANIEVNGDRLRVGCGTLSGDTFTPRVYVTIDTTGDGTGVKTYTAPEDFASFQIVEGDLIYFYSDGVTDIELDRTNTGPPLAYGYIDGDKMDSETFGPVAHNVTRALEIEFLGQATEPGWDSCECDGQDPADIDEIDGLALSDIDEIDEL